MDEDSPIYSLCSQLRTVLYVCFLIRVTKPHVANPLLYCINQRKYNKTNPRIKIQRTSVDMLYSKTDKIIDRELDINAVVLISQKLAIQLGLTEWQWKRVSFSLVNNAAIDGSTPGPVTEHKRWIRVLISYGTEDHLPLVSPVLYHNVQEGDCHDKRDVFIEFCHNDISDYSEPVRRIVLLWNNVQGCDPCNESSKHHQSSPDVAAEVYVKAIDSVKYRCGGELESLLKDYFRTPKVIAVGDCIALPVPKHRAHEFTPGSSIIPPKHVFITVTQVKVQTGAETRQCVQVSVGVTDLYLSGSTHCLLPVMYENFNADGQIDYPPLLKDTVNKVKLILESNLRKRKHPLCTRVRPINTGSVLEKGVRNQRYHGRLKGKLNSREDKQGEVEESFSYKQLHTSSVTLLLLGPPGSGKKQVIKLSASSLGLGVVWANCWQLKGDTSGGTEARLRQMFIRASAMGPCILALLNVHCLSNVSKMCVSI